MGHHFGSSGPFDLLSCDLKSFFPLLYAPAYAGAAVAEAKAKAKASMAKYLASLVKREEEGWTVLAAEVPQAPDERFFSSADELEQAPLIPAKRKAEDEPMEDAAPGVAQVPKALTRPPGALLELLNPPEEDVPMEELLGTRRSCRCPGSPWLQPAWRRPAWMPGKTPSGRGAGS